MHGVQLACTLHVLVVLVCTATLHCNEHSPYMRVHVYPQCDCYSLAAAAAAAAAV